MLFQSFVLFLTISLSGCMPQLDEGPYTYWRNRPRSIPSYANYYNQAIGTQDPQTVASYNRKQEYRPPYMQARARGPTARTDDVKEVRIMNYPAQRVSTSDTMFNDQNSDFFFPGYVNNRRTTIPTIKPVVTSRNPYIPDVSAILKNCPAGSTFCESIDNYPSDYINNVLQEKEETYRDFFGKDELIPVNISTRIGVGDGDGTPMCAATERVIQPPVAKNADDEWKYIVNDEKYVQGIRVEICQKTGSECAMSQNFPLTYETECKQKYIFRKLLSLDSAGEMQTDNFRFPSCCVCVYRSKRQARSVFGVK